MLNFVLGFLIETLSLMIVTIPFVTPLVAQLGFDLVWSGILLIVLIEMALITPPVGLNLASSRGLCGSPFERRLPGGGSGYALPVALA